MITITYIIDDEPQTTSSRVLTPAQILSNAGIDPDSHYLVELRGNHRESYEGRPDAEIHMHPHMNFISVSTEPTPVS
jgi:hypothetical protein